jgi:hypothetical protein
MNPPSLKPLKITFGSLSIFLISACFWAWGSVYDQLTPIFASQVAPPVSTTPMPPVSTTGVVDSGGNYGKNIRLQTLNVNLKAKIYIYVISTTQRCPNKIAKIFLIEDFFHLLLVSMTLVVHLEL